MSVWLLIIHCLILLSIFLVGIWLGLFKAALARGATWECVKGAK